MLMPYLEEKTTLHTHTKTNIYISFFIMMISGNEATKNSFSFLFCSSLIKEVMILYGLIERLEI